MRIGCLLFCKIYDENTQTNLNCLLTSFTAFDSLTEADVTGWVEAALGEEQVASIKASIENQIAEKITPTVVTKQLINQ